jgi:hypothetical protein
VVAWHIARDAKSICIEGMYRINALLVDRGSRELGYLFAKWAPFFFSTIAGGELPQVLLPMI